MPEYKNKDEIGTLFKATNKLINFFSKLIDENLKAVNKLVESVIFLRGRAEKTSEGAKEQSSRSQQVATAADEMSQTITDIVKNATGSAESSESSMKIAYEGKEMAENTVSIIKNVYKSTEELSKMVEKLNERASEIGDIINVIKDIADQTNL